MAGATRRFTRLKSQTLESRLATHEVVTEFFIEIPIQTPSASGGDEGF